MIRCANEVRRLLSNWALCCIVVLEIDRPLMAINSLCLFGEHFNQQEKHIYLKTWRCVIGKIWNANTYIAFQRAASLSSQEADKDGGLLDVQLQLLVIVIQSTHVCQGVRGKTY